MLYTTPLAFERQHLTSPASEDEYYKLLKYMAPVSTTTGLTRAVRPSFRTARRLTILRSTTNCATNAGWSKDDTAEAASATFCGRIRSFALPHI